METIVCPCCFEEFDIKLKKDRSLKCPQCFKEMKQAARKKALQKTDDFTCSLCEQVKSCKERKGDSTQCKTCCNKAEQKRYLANKEKVEKKGVIVIKETTRVCTQCNEEKSVDEFNVAKTKGTLRAACKECTQKARKKYYSENHDKVVKCNTEYQNKRSATDPIFKLEKNLRCRLYHALRSQAVKKSTKTFDLVGCSVDNLWFWLESRFQPGMTRENYGEWHVDHIKAVANFDLEDEEEQKKCFHYTNLQPLWAEDNLKKGTK